VAALDPDMMARLVTVQLIGDAIEYRRGQAAMRCADCGPGDGGRCAGYAQVEEAIRVDEDQYALACSAALECLEPADVSRVMGGCGPDPVAGLHGVAILRLLRELAADSGPVPTSPDGRDAAIETEDDREGQHLLDPPTTD
jgi:hypothetical protein